MDAVDSNPKLSTTVYDIVSEPPYPVSGVYNKVVPCMLLIVPLIAEAVNFEIQRGGQVFFVHNRIENINEVSAMISRLAPNADIGIVHGRIEGVKLEKTMLDFINGKFDVLVSTTIIESGLDVPNANTIFINNAQNFGLSDLHQMRGRVGDCILYKSDAADDSLH